MEASNRSVAVTTLKENGFYPLNVTEQGALQKDIVIGNPVKTKDLAIFCRQLASILNAGVTILDALYLLQEQTANKYLRKVLEDIYQSVEQGDTLASSMQKHQKYFPNLLINMVEAGEVSGNLEISFDRMALNFEKEYKLQQSVQKAVTYPALVSIIAVVVIGVLITVVVPTFVGMFSDMGMDLPVTTRALLGMGEFMKTGWWLLLITIALIIAALKYYSTTEAGKITFGRLKLKIPIFGKLNTKVAASRFTRTMSTLLASGLPILKALDVTAKIVGNYVVEKGLLNAREQVSRGMPLAKPIKDMDVFEPMVTHMVKIGEETGQLEDILVRVADFYDDEVQTTVTQLTTMLEPLIIIVLAVIVGFVVISIVQPMFQMYNGMGQM